MMLLITKESSALQKGFTLVELMVVIVIMSIFAVAVVGSIQGTEYRKLMQQREILINDLASARIESLDQAKIFALLPTSATATQPAGYLIAEYQLQSAAGNDLKSKWKPIAVIPARQFEDNAYLQIKSMDTSNDTYTSNEQSQALTGKNAPDLIWYGNGEVRPVRLQLFKADKAVGEPIYVNSAGKTSDTENGS